MKLTLRKLRRRTIWPLYLFIRRNWALIFLYTSALILGYIIGTLLFDYCHRDVELLSPLPDKTSIIKVQQAQATEPTIKSWTGIASYYSRSGCLGCSKALKMANGQPLVDENLTVAFNKIKLGGKVRVVNLKTNESVIATVTDTGGFERLGRIIDLTIGTRNAINCTNLCRVRVELVYGVLR